MGINPTSVGKLRRCCYRSRLPTEDQPHKCGETPGLESPPEPIIGINPTSVGKLGETTRFFARSREDQPHKCGETTLLGINPTRAGNHCLYYNQSTIHLWSMRIYSVPARAYNVATDHRSSPCAETRVADKWPLRLPSLVSHAEWDVDCGRYVSSAIQMP